MAMGVIAALQMEKSLARSRQMREKHSVRDWEHLITGRNASMCVLLSTAFVLYTELLFQDVMQRENFPGFLTAEPKSFKVTAAAVDQAFSTQEPFIARVPLASPPPTNTIYAVNMKDPKSQAAESTLAESKSEAPMPLKLKVLVGVFMMSFNYGRRKIIRAANSVQSSEFVDFTVRFIVGGYILPEWVLRENATYGDFIVLQCIENLNNGKTFTFFSTLPVLLPQESKFDYVMKTDDDSYVRFENLGKHLQVLPRTDLYYGYSLPCDKPPNVRAKFRVGAGYVLSWDLVVWIGQSPIPRTKSMGTEDRLVGEWFFTGRVAKNQPIEEGLFHDHPQQGGPCAHNLTAEDILVHKLKTDERWFEVMKFFEQYNHKAVNASLNAPVESPKI